MHNIFIGIFFLEYEYDTKPEDFKLCEVKFYMFMANFNFYVKNVGGRSANGNSPKRRKAQF
jgi:hypothetical protein